jgi:hypothetical protein
VIPVCSFCGEAPVVRWHEGPDFTRWVGSGWDVRTGEAWLVCAGCAPLVDAGARDELARRGAQRTLEGDAERLVHRVRMQQDRLFWSPREG